MVLYILRCTHTCSTYFTKFFERLPPERSLISSSKQMAVSCHKLDVCNSDCDGVKQWPTSNAEKLLFVIFWLLTLNIACYSCYQQSTWNKITMLTHIQSFWHIHASKWDSHTAHLLSSCSLSLSIIKYVSFQFLGETGLYWLGPCGALPMPTPTWISAAGSAAAIITPSASHNCWLLIIHFVKIMLGNRQTRRSPFQAHLCDLLSNQLIVTRWLF
jgi:hypothetical protein